MEQKNKKKILTGALAAALAAILLIGGGTFAYLQDETEETVNNFKTNQVTVDLDESTGNEYNIIPGTSQEKDPKVTVNNTVDAYVYVKVTDNTQGLVEYEIADGWTKLEGFDDIYYREVPADSDIKEFYVLKDNTVIYDPAILNSDMVDENGVLKDDVFLSFNAYAVQKEPFTSERDAYHTLTCDCGLTFAQAVFVETAEELQDALDNNKNAILMNDISGNLVFINPGNDVTVCLNGHTVSSLPCSEEPYRTHSVFYVKGDTAIEDKTCLTIAGNGSIDATQCTTYSFAAWAANNAEVTIKSGTFTNYEDRIILYSSGKSEIIVNGGTFIPVIGGGGTYQNNFMNIQNNSGSKITCYGGTFVNYNPADGDNSGNPFVADGYTVTSTADGDNTLYTVVKNS